LVLRKVEAIAIVEFGDNHRNEIDSEQKERHLITYRGGCHRQHGQKGEKDLLRIIHLVGYIFGIVFGAVKNYESPEVSFSP